MIDIATEQLMPIREVPRFLPPRLSGRRVHVSAVYRWMNRGVRGVRLEGVKVGGTMYTSVEALQRFGECLSGRRTEAGEKASRRKAVDAADSFIERELGIGESGSASTG